MDEKVDFSRTLVIGNCGSGKSWLAARLAAEPIDLDLIHWAPGGYNLARDAAVAIELVRREAARDAWVIEGVFGWLAVEVMPRATALVWLDLPIEECLANLRARGLRRGGDATAFAALLAWAGDYGIRESSSSFAGHARLFEAFGGHRIRLGSRAEIAALLAPPVGKGYA